MAVARWRLLVAGAVVLLWQLWSGAGQPATMAAPSTDPGLCLALALRWAGMNPSTALGIWFLSLLGAMILQALPPFWLFVLGWPAWRATRDCRQSSKLLLIATICLVLSRCGGKLLLVGALPWLFPLTLSGTGLMSSLWAETASSAFLLSLFLWLLPQERSHNNGQVW